MNSRPNILYVVEFDPRESDSGIKQRTNLLWRSLQQLGAVYTAVVVGWQEVGIIDEECRIAGVCFDQRSLWGRRVSKFCHHFLSPCRFVFHSKKELLRRLPWDNVKFDYVVTRYMRIAASSNGWKIAPLIVDVDDIPSEQFETVQRERGFNLSSWFKVCLLKFWQRRILGKALAFWVANPAQASYFQKGTCAALENIPLPHKAPNSNVAKEPCFMTVGQMGYAPNYMGIDGFLENVWIKFVKKQPDYSYWIVGKGLPIKYQKKWGTMPGVKQLGFVEDLSSLYEKCEGVVAPINSGGGTCIKTLEAVSYGCKVYATPFAVRGLNTKTREELSIDVFEGSECFVRAHEGWIAKSETERRRVLKKSADYVSINYSEKKFHDQVAALFSMIDAC